MRREIIIFIILCLSVTLYAIPAYNGKRVAIQPDGTVAEYFMHGDEVYHYMTDAEGFMLERDAEGYLKRMGKAPTEQEVLSRRSAAAIRKTTPRRVGSSNLVTKGLVILVNFSNTKFKNENTREAFEEMLNGNNYTYNGASGSVRKYYADQSDSAFIPSFDVFGPVDISMTAEWYGATDSRIGRMVTEAVDSAKVKYDIDYSEYDEDGDGYVDFVDILYAGYGAADSDYDKTVWPCEWDLNSTGYGQVEHDDVYINTFSCHQELCGFGKSTGKRAGIGTPCHEFAHVFGLPDLYDTSYKNCTMGEWDLMDQGAYDNEGRTPPGFSGYERMFAGWAKPRLLNEPENVLLQELQQSQQVFVVTTTGNHNLDVHNPTPATFYLLENRQQTGWDTYLPGHGMLIWKIQYNASRWASNSVNSAAISKQGITLLPADGEIYHITYEGSVYSYGDTGDPYPGKSNITSYEGITGFKISDIQESNGDIRFKIKGGVSEPFSVSFEAGEHGICSTTTIKETETGEGIILPDVIADEDYEFKGWSEKKSSDIAEAGKAGDKFYPQYDMTLYAVYDYTKYKVEWDAEHATITPKVELSEKNLLFTVVADEGYTVTADDIAITMGERDLAASVDFTFEDSILTIPSVDGDIYILIIAQKTDTTTQAADCLPYKHPFEVSGHDIFFKRNAHINIYDSSGRLHIGRDIRSGESLQLPAGLYLLQTEGEIYYKILIR